MIRTVFFLFFIFIYVNIFCQEETITNIIFPEEEYIDGFDPFYETGNAEFYQTPQNVNNETLLIQIPAEPVQQAEQHRNEQTTTLSQPEATVKTEYMQPVLTPTQMQPPPQEVQTSTPAATIQTPVRTSSPVSSFNNNEGRRLVLVNQEIVNWIKQLQNSGADIKKLVFYISKSFTMEIDEPDIEPNLEIRNDGMLMISDQAYMAPIRFTTEQQGSIRNFSPDSNETFVINIQNQNNIIPLKFKKNINADFYELFAIEFATGTYILRSNEQLPNLYIFASINRNERVITSSVQAVPMSSQEQTVRQNNAFETRSVTTVNVTSLQNNVQSSRNIIAQGTLKEETIFNFIKSRNPTTLLTDANIRLLINYYISEAAYEKVNHDLAVVQMLYVTNFLRNNQLVNNNNFGGLNETREWQGRFPNILTGVRAHIQHLRAYASTTLIRQEIINPRMNQLSNIRGTVQTFDQLYEKWTVNPQRYRTNIDTLLKDIYLFSK